MKRILSILLVMSVMAPNVLNIAIFIDFKLNQEYIADTLCINKYDPEAMCNGKCYLAQKLEEQQDKEKQQKVQRSKQEVLFICEYKEELVQFTYSKKFKISDEYFFLYTSNFLDQVFKPPKIS